MSNANEITNCIILSSTILGSVYLLNKSLERVMTHKTPMFMDKVIITYTCITLVCSMFKSLQVLLL